MDRESTYIPDTLIADWLDKVRSQADWHMVGNALLNSLGRKDEDGNEPSKGWMGKMYYPAFIAGLVVGERRNQGDLSITRGELLKRIQETRTNWKKFSKLDGPDWQQVEKMLLEAYEEVAIPDKRIDEGPSRGGGGGRPR